MKQKWTLDELIDVWTLSSNELALVNRGKADHNRLGCAVLLKYFQIEGRFPRRQHDVPQTAIEYVAKQLRVAPDMYGRYNWRGRSIKIHRALIRTHLGFREGSVADAEVMVGGLCAEIR